MSLNNRWNTLKKLMNDNGLLDTIDHKGDFVTAYTFRWNPDPNKIKHFDIPNLYNLPFTDPPSGGTNFANAINRAIAVIDEYPY